MEIKNEKNLEKKAKAFKLNQDELSEVMSTLEEFVTEEEWLENKKVNEDEKLLRLINFAKSAKQEQSELDAAPTAIQLSYKGDKQKLNTAVTMISEVFNSQLIHVNEVVKNREDELVKYYDKELTKVSKVNEELIAKNSILENEVEQFKTDYNDLLPQMSELSELNDNLKADNQLRDTVISGLTIQVEELKAQMEQVKADAKIAVEDAKAQVALKDSQIANLVDDSRKYTNRIEVIELENKELQSSFNEVIKENNKLTNDKALLEVNFANANEKNTDLHTQITKLEAELQLERSNSVQIQSQIMNLMSNMNVKEPVSVEEKPKAKTKKTTAKKEEL